MTSLKTPLNISTGNFYENNKVEEKNMEKAVTAFIKLLVDSPNGSFKPDCNFGFLLKNCQYENIYAQAKNRQDIYTEVNKRKNSDFSKTLKETIQKFEPRLKKNSIEVTTSMETEVGKGKDGEDLEFAATVVAVNIKGVLINEKEYNKDFKLNIWS
ncbi:MAG: hypothetical protein FWD02_06160 [Bacteroidales bacterium]|nr:hypothetical protein [Bacteroidales bacterium]